MVYNKFRYLELLKFSDDLKANGKFMYDENREAYSQFLKLQILIDDHFLWEKRYEILSLINDFVEEKIDAKKFSNKLFSINRQNEAFSTAFQTNLEMLSNFEPALESEGFCNLVENLISDCEVLEIEAEKDEPLNKEWLRNSAKNTISKINFRLKNNNYYF